MMRFNSYVSYFQAEGWGGVLFTLGQSVYMMSPVFHCPKNPRNTIAPPSLMSFSNFTKVIVDTKTKVILIDTNRIKHVLSTRTSNDLDFVDLNIAMINPDSAIMLQGPLPPSAGSNLLNPSINAIESSQIICDNYKPILHPKVLEYFVLMHQ